MSKKGLSERISVMRMTYFPILHEIKEDYIKFRQEGNSRDQAVTLLIHSYAREIALGKADDGHLFWIGLADAQYYRKELSCFWRRI